MYPEVVTVEVLSANVNNNGVPVYVDMGLGLTRFRTRLSSDLAWGESCMFNVKDLKDCIVFKLKPENNNQVCMSWQQFLPSHAKRYTLCRHHGNISNLRKENKRGLAQVYADILYLLMSD